VIVHLVAFFSLESNKVTFALAALIDEVAENLRLQW
jgi:hypothetical protein